VSELDPQVKLHLVSITRSKPTAFRRCALSVLLDTGRMVEYRKSSHAIWEVPLGVDHEVPVQGAARGDRGADARFAAADMRRA
jgi:hypothetical protein